MNKSSSDNKGGLVIVIKDVAVNWTDKLQSNMSRKQRGQLCSWAACLLWMEDTTTAKPSPSEKAASVNNELQIHFTVARIDV